MKKQFGIWFLDSDVKKPSAVVSAMTAEGNTVVFSRKWGNYIEKESTKEKTMIEKVGRHP